MRSSNRHKLAPESDQNDEKGVLEREIFKRLQLKAQSAGDINAVHQCLKIFLKRFISDKTQNL